MHSLCYIVISVVCALNINTGFKEDHQEYATKESCFLNYMYTFQFSLLL